MKISGSIMFAIGLIMLLGNAYFYLADVPGKRPIFTIIGILFVGVGSVMVKKSRQQKN